jgi:hypothetical protein
MDSENRQCYQVAPSETSPLSSTDAASAKAIDISKGPQRLDVPTPSASSCPSVLEGVEASVILESLQRGEVWRVNPRRHNGLILCKTYHAEFAGPGAAVGGSFDVDCERVIPMGNLSLVRPTSHKERQDAYLIRRQWIKLTQQVTDQSVPLQRAKMILNQFENYFDQETIARIPDEAFATLVGVFPYSIRMARRTPGKLTVKVKT